MTNIDFILPWVDSSDKDWQKSFAQYLPGADTSTDFSQKRYRDNGLLPFWFRSVEKNASWVNKIHFVTCRQIPTWLNTDNPKLHIVKHSDYIPAKNLPTFSSHPIELYMHNIPGLSEQFVYFNDDEFITAKMNPEDFFADGIAKDYAVMNALSVSSIGHILYNNILQINRHFDKKVVLKNHFSKWFTVCYSSGLLRNILLYPWPHFTGFVDPHCGMPYTKSLLKEVWNNCEDTLTVSCSHRFRSNEDVNQFLFRYWRLCSGNFIPTNLERTTYFYDLLDDESDVCKIIRNKARKQVVISDNDTDDYDAKMNAIRNAFESVYPDKSSFER